MNFGHPLALCSSESLELGLEIQPCYNSKLSCLQGIMGEALVLALVVGRNQPNRIYSNIVIHL